MAFSWVVADIADVGSWPYKGSTDLFPHDWRYEVDVGNVRALEGRDGRFRFGYLNRPADVRDPLRPAPQRPTSRQASRVPA